MILRWVLIILLTEKFWISRTRTCIHFYSYAIHRVASDSSVYRYETNKCEWIFMIKERTQERNCVY